MVGVLRVSIDGVAVGNSFAAVRRIGASTSLSRKSRKRFPDTHAFKVFKLLISRLRCLSTVII